MYLLGKAVGFAGQEKLWQFALTKAIDIAAVSGDALIRMADLMGKYRDLPMDLADASLLVVAEERRLNSIFTLDGDFRIYRLADGTALEVLP